MTIATRHPFTRPTNEHEMMRVPRVLVMLVMTTVMKATTATLAQTIMARETQTAPMVPAMEMAVNLAPTKARRMLTMRRAPTVTAVEDKKCRLMPMEQKMPDEKSVTPKSTMAGSNAFHHCCKAGKALSRAPMGLNDTMQVLVQTTLTRTLVTRAMVTPWRQETGT